MYVKLEAFSSALILLYSICRLVSIYSALGSDMTFGGDLIGEG
jgi:hypothetical protein